MYTPAIIGSCKYWLYNHKISLKKIQKLILCPITQKKQNYYS